MNARMTVEIAGPDAAVLATAVEVDTDTNLPGASVDRTDPTSFQVTGDDPSSFRAAANTLLRLIATGAGVAGPDTNERGS